MDYEKKYKEALELARDYYKANLKLNNADENLLLEDIFPGIKESEDDRIRKELIRETKGSEERLFEIVTNDEFVSWLEKQGEQKPAWSDEDEEKLQDCIGAIWAADYYLYEEKQDMEAWLKSLKDRIGG